MLAELRAAGFRVSADDGALYVEPASRLTDDQRMRVRRYKPTILRELNAEAAERRDAIKAASAAAPLADFREALALGRLHICANCSRFTFAADPAQMGNCRRHGEVWPFVPFQCPDFSLSAKPVAPAYANVSQFLAMGAP